LSSRKREAATLGALLDDEALAGRLLSSELIESEALAAFVALAEQAVKMGIDYRRLGVGWFHPMSRTTYRAAQHKSILAPESRERAQESRRKLLASLATVLDEGAEAEAVVTEAFIREIGLLPSDRPAGSASFSAVAAALQAELLLPLRALNEGEYAHTMMGAPLPLEELRGVVASITTAVLSHVGGFAEWRYTNPVGKEQLRGLSERQAALWREPTEVEHAQGLRTHEDGPGELGLFWATKIGGPSHGFDFETQCVLPLLANARHKVLLLSDESWPHHPAGRAHWRLLWSVGSKAKPKEGPEPRLWLETLNCDFSAERVATSSWEAAALHHAMDKSEAMQVPLSVEPGLMADLKRLARSRGGGGEVFQARERLVLRPSNAVVEASDYLSPLHDWVQQEEEVTGEIPRALFVPAGV